MFIADISPLGSMKALGSDQYARAVVRHPPSHFIVEFLSPSASNGSYNHGLHIAPPMTSDIASTSSRGPIIEYDIWRSWEDCLWFQETLEEEYSRAAREKKVRLKQGKGVKSFNGMYKQDMASSWDSLPPGPDPKSVVQDIHGHLPRLSKKGTFFRPSQATIEQRHREFRNLIETLFSDKMPALIQEIRASNIVTEFFGLWKRDFDKLDRSPNVARSTITSSLFSSGSTPSLSGRSSISSGVSAKSLPNSPVKKSRSNHSSSESRPRSSFGSARSSSRSTRSTSASTDISEGSLYSASSECDSTSSSFGGVGECTDITYRSRPRPLSTALFDSSSTTDFDITSDCGSTGSTNLAIADDAPYAFGHNPQHSNERLSSVLEVLPEEREMILKELLAAPTVPKPRASAVENKSFQIVGSPAISDSDKLEKPMDALSFRESWSTCRSMDSNTNEIVEGLDFTLPNPVKENKFRASLASISTFMTTDSAEAVIPRNPSPNDRQSSPSLRVSLPGFDIYEDKRNYILDDLPRPTSYISEYSCDRPEPPTGHEYSDAPQSPDSIRTPLDTPPFPALTSNSFLSTPNSPDPIRTSFDRPSSPTCSIGMAHTILTVTSSVAPGSLSLKAAYNDTIILLRLPRETSFAEVRQCLYNKFLGQGVPLSHNFTVALVPAIQSRIRLSPSKDRLRSTSTSSASPTDLILINCSADWENLISSAVGSKFSLRILDPK